MKARRISGLVLLAAVAIAVAGCNHNTYSWAQPVPAAAPGGIVQQPTMVSPGSR